MNPMRDPREQITLEEAHGLVRELVAAFPFAEVPVETVDLFRRQLFKLEDAARAVAAVQKVIETERDWPPFAAICRAYALTLPARFETELEAWRRVRVTEP